MNKNFWLGAAVGLLAAYLWNKAKQKSGKNLNDLSLKDVASITKDVVVEEGGKFSDAVKKEYDIIMPSDQISKKVQQRADKLTRGRYAPQPQKVKEPVKL